MSTGPAAARIRQLPGALANQIAAGEVVERPASVVKELVENSLDAGATRIDVELEHGGLRLIRVRDDGHGIHRDDLRLAFDRHATSKISSIDDLARVLTMGFRGEALPSIALVARLTLASRAAGSDSGWSLTIEGGAPPGAPQPDPLAAGTVLTVRDLFYNVPARRRFLRTERTELRHAEDAMTRLALARFDVAFTLHHDGRRRLGARAADGGPGVQRRLASVCGAAFAERAIALDSEATGLRLRGWIGDPAAPRAHPDVQHFYVNGRAVRDAVVRHAVRQALGESIPDGRHPAYVLYLEIDPAQVDVNVHPTKQEVRFREARVVHDFVARGVRGALEPALIPGREVAHGPRAAPPGRPGAARSGVERLADGAAAYRALYGAGAAGGAQGARSRNGHAQPARAAGSLVATLGGGRFALLRRGAGHVLLDVPAARARLVAALHDPSREGPPVSRPLLVPETVTVTGAAADAAERASDPLAAIGFDLRRTGPDRLSLREVPAVLADLPAHDVARALVDALGAGADGAGLARRLADWSGEQPPGALTPDLVERLVHGLTEAGADAGRRSFEVELDGPLLAGLFAGRQR